MARLKMLARDALTVAALIGFFVASSGVASHAADAAATLGGYLGGR